MGISKIGVLSPELVTGSVVRRVGPSSPSPSLSKKEPLQKTRDGIKK